MVVNPHISNLNIFKLDYDAAMEYYKLEWCKDRLKELGDLARQLDIRLTFHLVNIINLAVQKML